MHLLALALALTVHVLLPACVCMVFSVGMVFSACLHGFDSSFVRMVCSVCMVLITVLAQVAGLLCLVCLQGFLA